MLTLTAQVQQLANLRSQLGAIQTFLKVRREEFHRTVAAELAVEDELKVTIAAAETQLREEAAALAATTGNMKGIPGVECKRFKTLVYDEAQALEWAIAHGIGLALDREEFEAIVLALRPEQRHRHGVPVAVREEIRATIARDLPKALGVATLVEAIPEAGVQITVTQEEATDAPR